MPCACIMQHTCTQLAHLICSTLDFCAVRKDGRALRVGVTVWRVLRVLWS